VVKEEIAKGKIVLFSSHQMNYIEEFCDAIAILNGGHIALCGNLREIKHNYTRDKLVVRSQQAAAICGTPGLSAELLENGEVLVKLPSPEDKKQVMRQLTESYDIDEIRVYEPSLNDIFVEYAGDKEKGEDE
jgi:ABC-2 type transport system ATP-binding protein